MTLLQLQGGSRPHVIFAKNEVRISVFDDGSAGKDLPTGFSAEVEGRTDGRTRTDGQSAARPRARPALLCLRVHSRQRSHFRFSDRPLRRRAVFQPEQDACLQQREEAERVKAQRANDCTFATFVESAETVSFIN